MWGAQGIAVALAVAAAAWAFGLLPGGRSKDAGTDSGAAGSILSVSTAAVVQGTIRGSAHLTGTVQSADPRQVTPAVAGKLATLPVKEGTKIKAGRVVATLVDPDSTLALSVATAQSNLAKARQELDRLEHPVADSAQLGQARAAVKSAQEALGNAREKRDKAESDYDKAERNFERAQDRAEASASSSSASASAAAKSSAAAASSAPPTVTVTVTPTGSPSGTANTGAGTGLAPALALRADSDPTPTDVGTAASDLSAARARRDAARDAVTTARENLHAAERTLAAYEHLDPAAQAQIIQTRAQANAAQAQLGIAARNLAALTVTAPVSGTVTSVPLLVGSTVTSASVLAQIDSGGFEAKASADAAVAGALQTHSGTPVSVTGPGIPRTKAQLRVVSPTTDTASDQTDVTFTLLPGKKTIVRPGATVGIDISLPPGRGLVVPASAVVSDGQDAVVFTVTPSPGASAGTPTATARRIKVTLVTADAARALVAAPGLTPGSQVVVTGQTQLTDGSKVTVLPADTASTAPPGTTTGPAG